MIGRIVATLAMPKLEQLVIEIPTIIDIKFHHEFKQIKKILGTLNAPQLRAISVDIEEVAIFGSVTNSFWVGGLTRVDMEAILTCSDYVSVQASVESLIQTALGLARVNEITISITYDVTEMAQYPRTFFVEGSDTPRITSFLVPTRPRLEDFVQQLRTATDVKGGSSIIVDLSGRHQDVHEGLLTWTYSSIPPLASDSLSSSATTAGARMVYDRQEQGDEMIEMSLQVQFGEGADGWDFQWEGR
jgi:hypothetical protein